jgi:cytochrome b561
MGDLHQVLAWGLLGLIGLHLAGALYHHLILRDGVLRRMA